jgi:hypothetical protein
LFTVPFLPNLVGQWRLGGVVCWRAKPDCFVQKIPMKLANVPFIVLLVVLAVLLVLAGQALYEEFGQPVIETRVNAQPSRAAALPSSPRDHASVNSPGGGIDNLASIPRASFKPREEVDTAGFKWIMQTVEPWGRNQTSLESVAQAFTTSFRKSLDTLTQHIESPTDSPQSIASARYTRASFYNAQGEPEKAYQDLCATRAWVEQNPLAARDILYSVIYFQGVSALRLGENENCIMCRGESSCILPITTAAQHQNTRGSELAIRHFTEYLEQFPDDLDVRWLLNVASMTLGKHPQEVPAKHLISLDRWCDNQATVGRFRDIGALVGLNRFNQAGGAIMDDFDNDRRLDIVVSTFDPTVAMAVYRNNGQGAFQDMSSQAGVSRQLGGLNCVQADFNNDGLLDVLIIRGAWLSPDRAIRPSLLLNKGNFAFEDVTEKAGLSQPINAIAAAWADYDNDGWLDLFIPCEQQANRLYRNNQDGTFTERAREAGLAGLPEFRAKGATWIDYDNDGDQDLFVTHLSFDGSRLYRNERDGTFTDVSQTLGISDPVIGFSCWSFDYDNDGWLDIFATSYDRSIGATVLGMQGQPTPQRKSALYHNLQGKGFQNVAAEMGVDGVYFTMGSNFGDFNNDGFLDFYLGTGDPNLNSLVPNRMFLNLAGKQFAEVTKASGTGNLQKGHGVACGDWDCDGNVDLFIQMGGAVSGDKYHNILFQNPGTEHRWLTVKLVGTRSNRAAMGAHLVVTTKGPDASEIHRWVSSGSSFGANPLEQTIGLGAATEIESLSITWPATGLTQKFSNVGTNCYVEITEGSDKLEVVERPVIRLREEAKP